MIYIIILCIFVLLIKIVNQMKTLKSFLSTIKVESIHENNTFKSKNHEIKFEDDFLLSNGYVKLEKESPFYDEIKKTKSLIQIDSLVGEFLFISQPFGSQKHPDLIVVINGIVLWLELKKSKGNKISWNTGYPRLNCLYVFDSDKLGRVVFIGQDHPTHGGKEEANEKFNNRMKELAKELAKSTPEFAHLEENFYNRAMFTDKTTDYNIEELYDKAISRIENL